MKGIVINIVNKFLTNKEITELEVYKKNMLNI